MIYEAIKQMKNPEDCPEREGLTFAGLMVQSVATSIDALIVGVTCGNWGRHYRCSLHNCTYHIPMLFCWSFYWEVLR